MATERGAVAATSLRQPGQSTDSTAGKTGAREALGLALSHLRRARELWRDFTGESSYERYLERHRRDHPGCEPMSARQWWRQRDTFDSENFSNGCC